MSFQLSSKKTTESDVARMSSDNGIPRWGTGVWTLAELMPRLHLIHVARIQVVSTCIRIQVARPGYS